MTRSKAHIRTNARARPSWSEHARVHNVPTCTRSRCTIPRYVRTTPRCPGVEPGSTSARCLLGGSLPGLRPRSRLASGPVHRSQGPRHLWRRRKPPVSDGVVWGLLAYVSGPPIGLKTGSASTMRLYGHRRCLLWGPPHHQWKPEHGELPIVGSSQTLYPRPGSRLALETTKLYIWFGMGVLSPTA